MSEIDRRIVDMQLNNKDFEKNAEKSISTLSKLKTALNFTKVSKNFSSIETAANKLSFSGLSKNLDTIANRFTSLGVIGTTALQNITNSAINAGKQLLNTPTITPTKTGFSEYETQINSVQTILANTKKEGATLNDVNAALDELNLYADKTIYNFTEMTRNIGTFTAAGVKLDTAVSAIKGIANLAAISGSTSQQASTAMYQLSQAIASGTVKLMDWNSVVNAGMGGQVFQDALKETAKVHGIAIDEMIEKEGSFRETLQKGWLTSEILTETLSKFTGDLSASQIRSMGYTEEQTKEILELGRTANDAATKVKTFSQLFDTAQEGLQSGWAQSFEIIFGDYEEAKELFSGISDTLGQLIQTSADSRNRFLRGWLSVGGRGMIVDSIKNIFTGLSNIANELKNSFSSVFEPISSLRMRVFSKDLKSFSEKFKEFFGYSEKNVTTWEVVDGVYKKVTKTTVTMSDALNKFSRIFKGIFSIFGIGAEAIKAVGGALFDVALGVAPATSGILDFFAGIGDYINGIYKSVKASNTFVKWGNKIAEVITPIAKEMPNLGAAFVDLFGTIGSYIKSSGIVQTAVNKLKSLLTSFASYAPLAIKGITSFIVSLKEFIKNNDVITKIIDAGHSFYEKFKTLAKNIAKIISDFIKDLFNIDPGDFDKFVEKLREKFSNLGELFTFIKDSLSKSWSKIKEKVSEVFKSVSDAFKNGVNLIKGILTKENLASIKNAILTLLGIIGGAKIISAVSNFSKIGKALSDLVDVGKELAGNIKKQKGDSFVDSFLKVSASLALLSLSLTFISKLNVKQILSSLAVLGALAIGLIGVSAAFKKFGGEKAGSNFILIATALTLLIIPLNILSKMDSDAYVAGVARLGVLMLALAITMKALDKASFGKNARLISLAATLTLLLVPLNILANMDSSKYIAGVTRLTSILLMLAIAMKAMDKVGFGKNTRLISLAVTLTLLIIPLNILSKMDSKSMVKGILGLITIGTALIAFSKSMSKIGQTGLSSFTSIIVLAGSLLLFTEALKELSDYPLDKMVGFSVSFSAILLALTASLNLLSKIPLTGVLKGTVGLMAVIGGIGLVLSLLGGLAGSVAASMSTNIFIVGSNLAAYSDMVASVNLEAIKKSVGAYKVLGEMLVNTPIIVKSNLDDFLNSLVRTGSALKLYTISTSGIDRAATTNSSNAVSLIEDIRTITNSLNDISGKTTEISSITKIITDIGSAIKLYAESTSGIDEGMITDSSNISEMLSNLAKNAPNQNDISKLTSFASGGGNELTDFAISLTTLGTAISAYSNSLSNTDTTKLNTATNSLTLLSDMAKTLPNTGGLMEWITGSRADLSDFAIDIASIGDGLSAYAKSVEGVNPTALNNATGTIGLLATIANTLPQTGGLFSFFTGDVNLSDFGSNLSVIGDGLAQYASKVSGISFKNSKDITDLLSNLASIESTLGSTGGVLQWFTGTSNLEAFGSKIEDLGSALGSFSQNTSGITADTSKGAFDVLNEFNLLNASLGEINTKNFKDFGNAIDDIGWNLNSFSSGIANLNTEMSSSAISIIEDLLNLASSQEASTENVNLIQSILNSFSTLTIPDFANAGKSTASAYTTNLRLGIQNGGISVINSIRSISSASVNAASSYQGAFYSIGSNMMRGMSYGIRDNAHMPISAAASVASRTLNATRRALDINSPSGKYEEIGYRSDQGLANGLIKYARLVSDASTYVGNRATDSAIGIIANISNLLTNEMDTVPTIRPVLDLSGISSDATRIHSILNSRAATTINTNYGARRSSFISTDSQNVSNQALVAEVQRVSQRVDALNGTMKNMKVVLDTGATVGGLKSEINRQLGKETTRSERGN